MASILVIEDDKDMQFVLSDSLQAEGYEVRVAGTGQEGLTRALSGQFDLVLLDLMLPDLGGVEVCKRIRRSDPATPVIMLTAKGGEIDKVVGLEVGADDYVTKPFSTRELLARIKAALRRSERAGAQSLRDTLIGEWRVDFERRELKRGSTCESLTRYEADLLRFLVEHRGQDLTRERILEEVWGVELDSGNRTVDNCIARLRGKLEAAPSRPQHILTVHGVGYKLL